ncbi:MAG: hypothetical protein COA96_15595 [SAR86 cluster bacterium]|uniref:Uncharacterized protein n=1 Tax=SAR86 cluster bacterium TaxID=2030880 RepID=A0A2A5ANM5_9GAMM|nr:MAG: hypothetical protein COA96_15595 [SAR86 cluster bacterium]
MSMEDMTDAELCAAATEALKTLDALAMRGRVIAANNGTSKGVIAADKFLASVAITHARAVRACDVLMPEIVLNFGGK